MAAFFSFLLAFILLLHTRFCGGSSHACNQATCSGKTVDCSVTGDCDVTCDGWQACKDTTINCNNANYTCDITCSQGWACQNTRIQGKDASSLHIITPGGSNNLENTNVTCPNKGNCSITCEAQHKACQSMTVNAESSETLSVICKGIGTICHDINIYCPLNGDVNECIIEGDPNTNSGNILNMDIYSRKGFDGVTVVGPNDATSIGSIHCAVGYTSSCVIDITDNNVCNPTAADKTCDKGNVASTTQIPTTLTPTTTIPTTNIPTTNMPTTNIPTTNIPTTNMPTTDAPTTAIPTTNIPTTNAPTTNIPTTNIPTTNIPTGAIPTTNMPTTNMPTTNAPTTNIPTTAIPTTNIPTTNAPTTNMPTTNAPTTNIPTTNIPTTNAPTTNMPSTNMPTTNIPSTTIPTTIQPSTNIPTTALPTSSQPTTIIPTTTAPTSSQPTTFNPTTVEPTTMTTDSSPVTKDFTISFEIDEQDVTVTDINEIIVESLTAYNNVNIVSTTINEGEVEVVVEIATNKDTDTDEMEDEIEDALQNKYGKPVDVSVYDNDSLNNHEQTENMMPMIIILMIIMAVLWVCICIILSVWCYRRIRKNKNTKTNILRIKSESEHHVNTLTASPGSTTELISMQTNLSDDLALTSSTTCTDKTSNISGEHNENSLKMWLDGMGLVEYYQLFINQGFGDQMSALYKLSNDDLKEIGISKMAHRVVILEQIKNSNGQYTNSNVGDAEGKNIYTVKMNTDEDDDLFLPSSKVVTSKVATSKGNETTNGINGHDECDSDDSEDDKLYQKGAIVTRGNK